MEGDVLPFIKSLMREKGLARLGDSFVNLVFSAAKTQAYGRAAGEKVPDKVLSESLRMASIKVPPRLSHGERGDIAEAILADAWTRKVISLDESIELLRGALSRREVETVAAERDLAARGFSSLILIALKRGGESGAYGAGEREEGAKDRLS
ncbi:MAG: hypothetical protein NO516_01095 [Candidatus Methanomethylicia archaeon]|nr:hypothetical protein [Candidatus Methanomethylicia archaeon]